MHESERQRALDDFGALDMAPDRILDEIATLAKELFDAPMAGVTLIDNDRQFLASAIGVPADDIPRVDAFCDITIRRPEHFVIEDTLLDPRYADNPVVRNPPHVRFYAGYPIETPDGHRIGSLCIMDIRPRTFTSKDATLLRDLAHRAQDRLWALSDDDLPIVPV
jgi:GAF domain-containing protein